MSVISQTYENLCNLIIRPPRYVYSLDELGPTQFRIGNVSYIREDLTLINDRGLTLQCSYYCPCKKETKRPCVIYSHGNCGSRLDALSCLQCLLPFSNVFSLDFSGSGLSDGEYISLGFYEKDDLKTAIQYLCSLGEISRIGLWGRSMGIFPKLGLFFIMNSLRSSLYS